MNMKRKICVFLTAILLVFACSACGSSKEPDVGVKSGESMPDFAVSLTDGTTASMSELVKENDLVVLNIFASWCGPCEHEFPDMERVYQANRGRMEILSLSAEPNDTMEIIADYKDSHKLSFPMGLAGDAMSYIKVSSFPTTFFIDRDGKIGFIKVGAFVAEGDFEEKVNYFLSPDYQGEALKAETARSYTKYILFGLPIITLLVIIGRWRLLRKAGRPGWHSLIPVLGEYQEFALCWKGWLGIAVVASVIAVFVSNWLVNSDLVANGPIIILLRVCFLLAYFVLWLIESLKLAKAFGRKTGAGILLWITGFLGRVVLGFSKAQYQGKEV